MRPTSAAKLFLVLLALLAAPCLAQSPRRLVLAIGINSFEDPFWPALRYAENDARAIHGFFTRETDRKADFARLLVADKPIGRQQILATLDELARENRSSDDVVIIFLATHGTVYYADDGSGELERYLILSSTNHLRMKETALPFREFVERFQKLKSRRRAIIIDSCYQGTGRSRLTPEMQQKLKQMRAAPVLDDPENEGELILASTRHSEPALELPDLGHGVYTHYLLQGFRTDLDRDGAVSLMDAHRFAATEVTRATEGRQNPTARISILGNDPIIVSGTPHQSAWYARLFHGTSFGERIRVFINGARGNLETGIPVEPGPQRVTIEDPASGAVLFDAAVQLEPGKEYSLEALYAMRASNGARASFGVAAFPQKTLRSQLGDGLLPAVGLAYVRPGVLPNLNAQLEFEWFPTTDRETEAAGARIGQRVSGGSTALLLTHANCLPFANLQLGGWNLAGECGGGFSAALFKVESDYLLESTQTALVGGGKLELRYAAIRPTDHVNLALHSSLAGYSRILKRGRGPALTLLSELGVSVGFTW